MAERVGFIGLGIMGQPMAANLHKAGYKLWVHSRRAESMKPLVALGATACSSSADVARQTDIVFVMVSDTPDVEQVIEGPKGILEGAQAGSVVVDMSSIAPLPTQRLAAKLGERGVAMLDAPVSGGDIGARDGTLSIMVGGKADVFQRVLPLFQRMGKNIVHAGDHGAGQTTKLCNQVVVAQTIAAVSEALLLAKAAGVDPSKVREALLGGFAGSKILEVHGKRMLERSFAPGFKVSLHQKDLRNVEQTAAKLGLFMPGTALVTQYYNAMMRSGQGDHDTSSLVTVLERIMNAEL